MMALNFQIFKTVYAWLAVPKKKITFTFLTLRDHGKVYVADMPNLSDGQLAHIGKENRHKEILCIYIWNDSDKAKYIHK